MMSGSGGGFIPLATVVFCTIKIASAAENERITVFHTFIYPIWRQKEPDAGNQLYEIQLYSKTGRNGVKQLYRIQLIAA